MAAVKSRQFSAHIGTSGVACTARWQDLHIAVILLSAAVSKSRME